MAYADITIADNTPTNITFRNASINGGKASYIDSSRGILDPRSLTIGHQKVGKGATSRVRTVVRFDDTQVDTDGVTSADTSVYLVIDRPAQIVASSDVKHLIVMVKNLLTSGNIDILLLGQQL